MSINFAARVQDWLTLIFSTVMSPALKTSSTNWKKKAGAQRWPGWEAGAVTCPPGMAGRVLHTSSTSSPPTTPPSLPLQGLLASLPATDSKAKDWSKIILNCTGSAIFLQNLFKISKKMSCTFDTVHTVVGTELPAVKHLLPGNLRAQVWSITANQT